MDIVGGWSIDMEFGIYRIPIRIFNPETEISVIKNCLFDTCFSGYLGLDKETINFLNLKKSGTGKGFTVQGFIEFENYEGYVEIIDNEEKSLVDISNIDELDSNLDKRIIPIQDFKIPIIGIKLIRQVSWMILSEQDAIFILR